MCFKQKINSAQPSRPAVVSISFLNTQTQRRECSRPRYRPDRLQWCRDPDPHRFRLVHRRPGATTGYAPFQLMFGRVPRLPVDVMFKQVLQDPVVVDHDSYVKTLMSYLHEASRIAQKHTIKEQDKQAKGYNRKIKGTHLNIGDRVPIANKGERGKKKLDD